jgi:sulfoxide reductase catalytic subunit YedY
MHVRRRRGWEIPENQVTPESVYLNRRQVLAGGSALIGGSLIGFRRAYAADDPSAKLYPVARNERYVVTDREVTPENANLTYNNFYEFRLGSAGDSTEDAAKLPIRPWEIKVEGLVEKEFTIGIDDLLAQMKLEERIYRHRCVETWAMVVPWTGFPMADFVKLAKPLSSAKYVRMETFMNPEVAQGQRAFQYPWPYVEGLTMAEATNELTLLVTGAYGKPVANQMGAPIRLHTPWKYGFKSVKSIVRFSFTEERPIGFWEALQSSEYGFWANVNPEVSHPRWSQRTERLLGTRKAVKTELFNGYGEFVADIYKGLESEPLYM